MVKISHRQIQIWLASVTSGGTLMNKTSISNMQSNANVITSLDAINTCCECGGGVDIINNIQMIYSYSSYIQNDSILPFNSDHQEMT